MGVSPAFLLLLLLGDLCSRFSPQAFTRDPQGYASHIRHLGPEVMRRTFYFGDRTFTTEVPKSRKLISMFLEIANCNCALVFFFVKA